MKKLMFVLPLAFLLVATLATAASAATINGRYGTARIGSEFFPASQTYQYYTAHVNGAVADLTYTFSGTDHNDNPVVFSYTLNANNAQTVSGITTFSGSYTGWYNGQQVSGTASFRYNNNGWNYGNHPTHIQSISGMSFVSDLTYGRMY